MTSRLLLVWLALASIAVARAEEGEWVVRVQRLLGGPCRPLVPTDVQTSCGMNDRVAVVQLPVDYLPAPPADAERILDAAGPRPGTHRIIALAGERLWVHDVTCGGCVRVQGRTLVVDLAVAPPDAMIEVQRRVGLPTARPLRNASEVRAAVRRLRP